MTTRMDYTTFISNFRDGFARPSRYRVSFNLPRGVNLSGGDLSVNQDATQGRIRQMEQLFNRGGAVNIKCHTMTFPQRSLLTSEHRQNSAPFRTPYSASYDPITFSFYANSFMDTRDYFEIWQSAAVNFGSNTLNFYDEFVSDVNLYTLDAYGEDSYQVTLYEAYPINIGLVDASYSNINAVTNVTVTMAFKSWLPSYNTSKVNRSA